MQVIICGAGRFGLLAALDLMMLGDHSVTLVDHSEPLMQYLAESYDFFCVTGEATNPDVLIKANIQNCDMIIAATSIDTNNMAICQIAHSLFNVKHKVARFHRDTFQDVRWKNLFGANACPIDHIMMPEWSIVQSLVQLLNINGAHEVVPFFDNNLLLIKSAVLLESEAHNKSVKEIKKLMLAEQKSGSVFDIITVKRENKYAVLSPDYVLQAGDLVYILTNKATTFRAMSLLGYKQILAEKMLIMGEGEILRLFTRWCVNAQPEIDFTVLVRQRAYADSLLAEFPNISVMMGSPFHEKLFKEADIEGTDLALALDNNQQTNILSALVAKVVGIKRSIAVVHNPFFLKMANLIDVDLLLNPQGVLLSNILKIVLRGHIEQMHALYDHEAEILEWVVDKEPTKEHQKIFQYPEEIFPLAIFRDRQIIMPLEADTRLEKDDRVLILIPVRGRNKLEQIISRES